MINQIEYSQDQENQLPNYIQAVLTTVNQHQNQYQQVNILNTAQQTQHSTNNHGSPVIPEINIRSGQLKNQKLLNQPIFSIPFCSINPQNRQIRIHKRNQKNLKKLVKKMKVEKLVYNFCGKLKRNITLSSIPNKFIKDDILKAKSPKVFSNFLDYFANTQGLDISIIIKNIISILSLILNFLFIIYFSLGMVFPQIQSNYQNNKYKQINNFKIFSIIFYAIQIFYNFIGKNHQYGKSLIFLNQIIRNYLNQRFIVDFIQIIVLCLDYFLSAQNQLFIRQLRLIIIIKLYQNLKKIATIQNVFITNFHRQQYWGLFIVILFNFCFAHILSIILNSMAFISPQSNWITVHNLQYKSWTQKYVWGYYWGVTIMLTVGFGDYTATNSSEALCLIFIEMFSCLSLAYNINCLGTLLQNLRQRSQEKNKHLKTFGLMCKQNQISGDLQKRVINYIQGNFFLKKQYNFQQQKQLISELPSIIRSQLLKQINISIFDRIPMFRNFTQKTRKILAQKIKKKVMHPNEVIQKKGQNWGIWILQKGEVALTISNKKNNVKNQQIIQTIKSDLCCVQKKYLSTKTKNYQNFNQSNYKLISLQFLKNNYLVHNLKSLAYTIMYTFQSEQPLIDILRQSSRYDFQQYCNLRDRQSYMIDENQIYNCNFCSKNSYHNQFKCPSLHYIPIHSIIIQKYIAKISKSKQKRITFQRKYIDKINNGLIQKKKDCQIWQQSKKIALNYQGDGVLMISQKIFKYSTLNTSQKSFMLPTQTNLQSQIIKQKKNQRSIKKQLLNNDNQKYLANNENCMWLIQCDEAFNWKYYFPESNPQNIHKNYKKKEFKLCNK